MLKTYIRNFVMLLACTLLLTLSCQQENQNPPAAGFNTAASDAQAVAIADRVMQAMGGRENWDNTRYLTWKFFGRRMHVWDKYTGDIRVESGNRVTLMNIHTKKGRVWEDGIEISDPDSLAPRLETAYRAWINDSYWLVMPYKLKDSGVTLKYLGERKMSDGSAADALELTFENVGVTPQNKYHVFVNRQTGLVEEWAFFRSAEDSEARFVSPWHDWQQYGGIMLSASRGERGHSDIAVYDRLPASVFNSPEPVDMMSLPKAKTR